MAILGAEFCWNQWFHREVFTRAPFRAQSSVAAHTWSEPASGRSSPMIMKNFPNFAFWWLIRLHFSKILLILPKFYQKVLSLVQTSAGLLRRSHSISRGLVSYIKKCLRRIFKLLICKKYIGFGKILVKFYQIFRYGRIWPRICV